LLHDPTAALPSCISRAAVQQQLQQGLQGTALLGILQSRTSRALLSGCAGSCAAPATQLSLCQPPSQLWQCCCVIRPHAGCLRLLVEWACWLRCCAAARGQPAASWRMRSACACGSSATTSLRCRRWRHQVGCLLLLQHMQGCVCRGYGTGKLSKLGRASASALLPLNCFSICTTHGWSCTSTPIGGTAQRYFTCNVLHVSAIFLRKPLIHHLPHHPSLAQVCPRA
jgi:hypothetical protein